MKRLVALGALGALALLLPASAQAFGISSFSAAVTAQGEGVPDTQAGSHPVALSMNVDLNQPAGSPKATCATSAWRCRRG